MELENKLSAPKIQQWDIHGVPVISIPIWKKRKLFFKKKRKTRKERKEKQIQNQAGKPHRSQGLRVILCGPTFCLLVLRLFALRDSLPFVWSAALVCTWKNWSAYFLPVKFCELDSFLSLFFHLFLLFGG